MKHGGQNLDKNDYVVVDVPHTEAKNFIIKHHYSKSAANTSVYRHGLYEVESGELKGVAFWMPPTKVAAQANFDGDWRRVLALSRLAVTPDTPRNGASFLMARSIRIIRKIGAWDFLLTFADQWQGHTGAIYKATNWTPMGTTKPSPVYVNEEGQMMGRKRGPRSWTHKEMLDAGFIKKGSFCKERFGMKLR